MPGDASIGTFWKYAVDDSAVTGISDFDSGSFAYEVLGGSDLRLTTANAYNDGIRGTRSRAKERVRRVERRVTGGMIMNPTPVELDQWLPRILGATESTDVFALAETIPEFGVLIDRELQRHIYTGCKVNLATFSCSQGGILTLRCDIEGKDEVLSATSFPGTVPAINAGAPYIFSDLAFALTEDASAAQTREIEISINNFLTTDRFFNSLTRDDLHAQDREVRLRLVVPYNSDTIDLYEQSVPGGSGTATFTNGNQSLLFTFANLTATEDTPTAAKEEGFLNLDYAAYMSSTTRELVVTNDSTA